MSEGKEPKSRVCSNSLTTSLLVGSSGVSYTPEQIKAAVTASVTKNSATLLADRYVFAAKLFGEVRQSLEWADGRLTKEEFDTQVLALLGPKTDADAAAAAKSRAKKEPAPAEAAAPKAADAAAAAGVAEDKKEFANIEDMYVGRELKEARQKQKKVDIVSKYAHNLNKIFHTQT